MMTRAAPRHRWILAPALLAGLALGIAGCSDDDSGDPCEGVPDRCDMPGGKSCAGDVVRTCTENAAGCLNWVDTSTCPAGYACFGGACVCDDECVPGDDQCHGNLIQRCEQTLEGCLYWTDVLDCAATDRSCDDTADATCVEGAGCGNDLQELPEVCDGSDLAGETCLSQGFGDGALACTATCDAYDTSACAPSPSCGNGTLDPPEVCDGSDLAGADCESRGFHGGVLACRANCGAYNTSGCDGFCGDGGVNGPEDCDLGDLGGGTCESLGFYEGVLTCDASCLFDASGCLGTCGDDVINGPEPCDGTHLGLITCLDFGYASGELTCAANCEAHDVTGCVSPWTVGQCRITDPVPSFTGHQGNHLSVTGQVWISGLTDVGSGPDPHALVWAEVGVGPDGSDPVADPTAWTWTPAVASATFTHATDDQYTGEIVVPPAAGSPYDYAIRFTADGGNTWVYCDRTDSSYDPADAGHLVVSP